MNKAEVKHKLFQLYKTQDLLLLSWIWCFFDSHSFFDKNWSVCCWRWQKKCTKQIFVKFERFNCLYFLYLSTWRYMVRKISIFQYIEITLFIKSLWILSTSTLQQHSLNQLELQYSIQNSRRFNQFFIINLFI